jgi:hypothetical protein
MCTNAGCGDMATSKLADAGLACFLLNEDAEILMDRKLMKLGVQSMGNPPFGQSMRNFHEVFIRLFEAFLYYQI